MFRNWCMRQGLIVIPISPPNHRVFFFLGEVQYPSTSFYNHLFYADVRRAPKLYKCPVGVCFFVTLGASTSPACVPVGGSKVYRLLNISFCSYDQLVWSFFPLCQVFLWRHFGQSIGKMDWYIFGKLSCQPCYWGAAHGSKQLKRENPFDFEQCIWWWRSTCFHNQLVA